MWKTYLIETIILILVLIISYIIVENKYSKGNRKGYIKVVTITIVAFIFVLFIQMMFERPEIKFSEVNTKIEAKSGGELIIPETIYQFKNITRKVSVEGTIDYNKIGTYKIKYKVPTLTGIYEEDKAIEVIDTIPPDIILEREEEYKQSYSSKYSEPGVKAIDIYDGDVSDSIKTEKKEINENEFEIYYYAQDKSGNKSEKKRHITIVDEVAPTITLNGQENVVLILGSAYEEKGATAIDEKEGDITNKITTEGIVNTQAEGNYEITYKVSDTKGNETIKIRNIKIVKEIQNAGDGKGVIYLTFDDGPSSSITPKVLDILKQKNVKGTFFIVNYDGTGETLVKREVAEGHTVAIHGYSHDYNSIYKSVDIYMNNITKLQQKIKGSTGYNATITRFPGGSSNTTSKYNPGIMTKLTKEVVARGYKYFDWNISSGDAGGAKSSDDVFNNVTKGFSKSRPNIVLMHDFNGNTKTLNALSSIIDYGISNGYSFNKITESTPMITHKPNN